MRLWGLEREGLGSLEGKLGGGAGCTGVPRPPSSRAGERAGGGGGGQRCLLAHPLIRRPPPRPRRSACQRDWEGPAGHTGGSPLQAACSQAPGLKPSPPPGVPGVSVCPLPADSASNQGRIAEGLLRRPEDAAGFTFPSLEHPSKLPAFYFWKFPPNTKISALLWDFGQPSSFQGHQGEGTGVGYP